MKLTVAALLLLVIWNQNSWAMQALSSLCMERMAEVRGVTDPEFQALLSIRRFAPIESPDDFNRRIFSPLRDFSYDTDVPGFWGPGPFERSPSVLAAALLPLAKRAHASGIEEVSSELIAELEDISQKGNVPKPLGGFSVSAETPVRPGYRSDTFGDFASDKDFVQRVAQFLLRPEIVRIAQIDYFTEKKFGVVALKQYRASHDFSAVSLTPEVAKALLMEHSAYWAGSGYFGRFHIPSNFRPFLLSNAVYRQTLSETLNRVDEVGASACSDVVRYLVENKVDPTLDLKTLVTQIKRVFPSYRVTTVVTPYGSQETTISEIRNREPLQ